MLQASYHLLYYRADVALLAGICLVGCLAVRRTVLKRSEVPRVPHAAFFAVAAIVLGGAALAEWAAKDRVRSLVKLFAGFGPTYAAELQHAGHELVTPATAADDSRYLEIIAREKRWLMVNPIVADIYTYRSDSDGRICLIVDSETDYNRNGRYDEEREERTAIGEVYDEATPAFHRALRGETTFDSTIMRDRWGIWVSSFTPIFGRDGRVEAAVGVDYPAASWLSSIGSVRAMCLGIALVLNLIILAGSTFIAVLAAEIEQRKLTQRRLEQASESAFSASAAKSEFLALMSHEVRTPLSAILGFANILGETRLDPKQRRYIDTINRAGSSLMELLSGILDYTRVESGKLPLEQIAWAPALLIHEVMELMSVRASERNLSFSFDNQLPDGLTLSGDPTRVRQILLNLVVNAVKFTPQGSVTVRADWQSAQGGGEYGELSIRITDTGIGIPSDRIPLLFQAFSQADASTTRSHGGTGLGLAISKRLADAMNAVLSLESTFNVGSTFSFRLPTRSVAMIGPTAPNANLPSPPLSNWGRTLVIDDTKLNRELLKVMLQRLGLAADTAASGPEGVRLAAQHHYDIIFTDLEMPEVDGFAAARAIREQELPGRRVPIVAISALTASATREKCLAAGMDDYLTKPVYLPALKGIVEALSATVGSGHPSRTARQDPATVT